MRSKVLSGLFILFSIFIVSTISEVSAASKSFYFPNVAIDVSINPDGSFDFKERRTFYFNGSFSQVYWNIPIRPGESIDRITVAENDNGMFIPYVRLSSVDETRPVYRFAVDN